jgi:hypothetical protein
MKSHTGAKMMLGDEVVKVISIKQQTNAISFTEGMIILSVNFYSKVLWTTFFKGNKIKMLKRTYCIEITKQ